MPKRALTNAAKQLHDALANPDELDLADREALASLHQEIETLLELSSEAPRHQQVEVQQQLPGTIAQLEGRYPRVSAALHQLLDTLTALGI